jgi:hypothetical protein
VSFESIDAALASQPRERDEGLLQKFVEVAMGPDVAGRRASLEGCILQREGKAVDAASKLTTLVEGGIRDANPHLRLAECLVASGDARAAEIHLRQALEHGFSDARDLWDAWMVLCLDGLRWSLQDTLERFPVEGPEGPEPQTTRQEGAYAEDIRWLLSELAAERAVRINCGGAEYVGSSGEVWGTDRFFLGGEPSRWSKRVVRDTLDLRLYQEHRSFAPQEWVAGYRLPLPGGEYRVTLHVWDEGSSPCPDSAVDVLVEGQAHLQLEGCEMFLLAFKPARARSVSFAVQVDDGALDIEFERGAGWARQSAIEIARNR